jgi:hypothetical protein
MNPIIRVICLFGFLTASCSTGKYSQKGDVNLLAIQDSNPKASQALSADQVADLQKNLTRGFVEDSVEFTLALNTPIFADLVAQSVNDGVQSAEDLDQLRTQILNQRVKHFTCFSISLHADAASKADYYFRDLKNWKGLIYVGEQKSPERLYFFPVVNTACSRITRELTEPVTVLLLTSNPGSVSAVHQLSWDIRGKKANSPELSQLLSSQDRLTSTFVETYERTLPKDVPGVLGEGADGSNLKSLSKWIQTKNYREILKEFPKSSKFSVWDDLSFSILFFGYAKETMEACDPKFVEVLAELPHTTLPGVVGSESVATLRDLQAVRCGALGQELYSRRSQLREAIVEITVTSITQQLEARSYLVAKRSFVNLAEQAKLLVTGHRRSSWRCLSGESDQCQVSMHIEKVIGHYEKAEKEIVNRSKNLNGLGGFIEQMNRLKRQRSDRASGELKRFT